MCRKSKKAFTLIELLATISIIALLLAILLPSLNMARQQAHKVICLSNLRQLCVASFNYCHNYDQRFPIAQWKKVQGNTVSYLNWDYTVVKISGVSQSPQPGTLWQGETIEKIQQCPAYKKQDNIAGVEIPFTGYNYNTSYIGHGQDEAYLPGSYSGMVLNHPSPAFVNHKIVMPAKVTEISRPHSCALFGDGAYSDWPNVKPNRFMRSPWHWPGDDDPRIRQGGTQGYRHCGATNVAWADGHAASIKEIFSESIPPVKEVIERHNNNSKDYKVGFLSSDNSAYDLK